MKKKLIIFITLLSTIGGSLTGCTLPSLTAPKTAEDLAQRYASNFTDNFRIKVESDEDVVVSAAGSSEKLKMNTEMNFDINGSLLHGDTKMDIASTQQTSNVNLEMYSDGENTWHKTDGGQWEVTSVDADSKLNFGEVDPEIFKGATLDYNKDDGLYIVSLSLKDIDIDKNPITSYVNIGDTNLFNGLFSENEMLSALNECTLVYTFDKDYTLCSLSMDDVVYHTTKDIQGTPADITVTMSLNIEFSEYNKIKKEDVEVPTDVKSSAIPSNKETSAYDFADDSADEVSTEITDVEELEEAIQKSTDEMFDDVDSALSTEDEGTNANNDTYSDIDSRDQNSVAVSDDYLGSYNGINLAASGNDFDSILGVDGWEMDVSDDGQYDFISCTNKNYDEDITFYVYSADEEKATINGIKTYGFSGYKIDTSFCKSDKVPNMTWNGVRLGASMNDIIAAYGTPDDKYEDGSYESLTYNISDSSSLEFCLYGEDGLREVNFYIWR